MSDYKAPPKTVCPRCGERSEREEIASVWRDKIADFPRRKCPKCGEVSAACDWKCYTDEERRANDERKRTRDLAYRASHVEQHRKASRAWKDAHRYEINLRERQKRAKENPGSVPKPEREVDPAMYVCPCCGTRTIMYGLGFYECSRCHEVWDGLHVQHVTRDELRETRAAAISRAAEKRREDGVPLKADGSAYYQKARAESVMRYLGGKAVHDVELFGCKSDGVISIVDYTGLAVYETQDAASAARAFVAASVGRLRDGGDWRRAAKARSRRRPVASAKPGHVSYKPCSAVGKQLTKMLWPLSQDVG